MKKMQKFKMMMMMLMMMMMMMDASVGATVQGGIDTTPQDQ